MFLFLLLIEDMLREWLLFWWDEINIEESDIGSAISWICPIKYS